MNRLDFLARIATRLGRPSSSSAPPRSDQGVPAFHVKAPLGDGAHDLASRFAAELTAVGGEAIRVASIEELSLRMGELLEAWTARSLVSWARAEFDGLALDWLWSERGALAFDPDGADAARLFRERAAAADVGLTTALAGVAASGSLLLTSGATRPRAASLLPTRHVAILREELLVARLGEAMERLLAAGEPPSAALFVSGPSRTSDIENDLTIGVHGPAAVTVLLLASR